MKWISVKDAFPRDVTPVLVYGKCCKACNNIQIAEREQDEWWESETGDSLHLRPSHWMPLPSSPITE